MLRKQSLHCQGPKKAKIKQVAIRGSWGWWVGGGGLCKEKRWMAVSKCHSLNILSGSLPTLPLSLCPSFSSCLSSSHLSPPFSLSSSASLSLLLTQRSCQCLLLLIQVSNPPPVKEGGRGTGRTIRGEFIRVAQSVITPVPLSLLLATTSLPCHRATDCSCYQSTHTDTHTHTQPTSEYACACLLNSFVGVPCHK